jgi:hypothetical protein
VRQIFAVAALFMGACTPVVRDYQLPAWARPVVADTAAPVQLQGKWGLNPGLSDDPQPLIRRAVESLRKSRRALIGDGHVRGRDRAAPVIKAGEGPRAPGEADPYRDAAVSDPRLAVLRAKTVSVEERENAIHFTFDDGSSVHYQIGRAISEDRNINLTFADWEGSQLVVEKNGPDGLVLERWILSPDGSQLYLLVSLEVKLPDFPLPEEPVLIGRMFDRLI